MYVAKIYMKYSINTQMKKENRHANYLVNPYIRYDSVEVNMFIRVHLYNHSTKF